MESSRNIRVVLLSPPGDLGYIVLRSLATLGSSTLLVCQPRSAIRLSRYRTRTLLTHSQAFQDPHMVADAINAEVGRQGVDVVLASSVPGLKLLAEIRDRIRAPVFPMPDLPTLEILNHKLKFADICAACGVPTPPTLFYRSQTELRSAEVRTKVAFPCVLKPVSASGGDGVNVVHGEAELNAALSSAAEYLHDGLLVQEYIAGRDVGLSVFAQDGEIKNWATFYCDGHWSTEFAHIPGLLEAGRAIIAHTRFTGIANFDARFDPQSGRLLFLECNPRFFRRVEAGRNCGLDFVAAGLAAMGLAADQPTSLTEGRHLSARDLFSRPGLKLVSSHAYSLKSASRDIMSILRDPAPVLGSFLHEHAVRSVKLSWLGLAAILSNVAD